MAKLCLVQQRDSICRTVLFTAFLVLTIINQCRPTSNQEICITNDTRKVSYFKINNKGVDWHTAWQTCIEQNSTLPVICNKNEQDALTIYLKATLGSSESWKSGKKINFANWTWMDGQPYIDRGISSGHDTYTHVALDGTRHYSAHSPQHKNYYLCHYSGSLCNSGNFINVTKGCIRPSDDYQTWYDARNQCLKNGSDLAILTEADLVTLRSSNKLDVRHMYWIGLRKNAWYWIWQRTVSDAETSSIRPTVASAMSSSPTTVISASSERECHSVSYATLISVTVIVAIFSIAISNIIVALAVRKYAYRRSSHVVSSSETTENRTYQDLETTRRQANPDRTYTELQLQSVYEEVCQRGN